MTLRATFEAKRFRFENLKRFATKLADGSIQERHDACYYVIEAQSAQIRKGYVKVKIN